MPDTCSGAISPDTIYPCSTQAGSGIDTFTFTLASASDRVLVRVMSVSGIRLGFTVTAPDSSTVNCQQPHDAYLCAPARQARTRLRSPTGAARTRFVAALLSDAACAVMRPSFAAAPVQASLVNGQTGDCYTLDVQAASVLTAVRLASASTVDVTVYDAAGADQSCNFTGGLNCTVGGIAPYRVLVSASGIANSYQLEISSLTSPAGCATAAQLTYGQVPDASSADPCRTLTVTKAGSYQVVMAGGSNVSGVLYASDGSRASCGVTGPYFCQLAVGAYHYVARTGAQPSAFGMVFIAADESAGCASTGDTGFVSGPVTGQFAAQGEELCLNLPTPSGKDDYFASQAPADGSAAPTVYVLDATGVTACTGANGSFVFAVCPLTGTAPFRVILVGSAAPARTGSWSSERTPPPGAPPGPSRASAGPGARR